MNILNTGIHCPNCSQEVSVMSGLVPDQVYFAIRRQQHGCFIECVSCKHRFTWMGVEEHQHAATPVTQPVAVPAYSPLSRPATNPFVESTSVVPSTVVGMPAAVLTPQETVAAATPLAAPQLGSIPIAPSAPIEIAASDVQSPTPETSSSAPAPSASPIQPPHFINRPERERESLPAWRDMDEFSR